MNQEPSPSVQADESITRDRLVLELLDAVLDVAPERREALLAEAPRGVAAEVRELMSQADSASVLSWLETPIDLGPDSDAPLAPGTQLDRFTVLEAIGQGGNGRVYRAEQDAPRREVALKVMRASSRSEERSVRFRIESEVLANLEHPNIAAVYGAGIAQVEDAHGESKEVSYFALEYVQNSRPITEWARETRPDEATLLRTFVNVVDALHHAHGRGVLHRDLKPANILVDGQGQPKVIDFGVARLLRQDEDTADTTRMGQLIGTPAYMAPEQVRRASKELDVRIDVFALGAVLFELLCGRRLHDTAGKSLHAIVAQIGDDKQLRPRRVAPDMDPDLEAIVVTAAAPNRIDRYSSAAEFKADLERYLRNEPVLARKSGWLRSLRLFLRRNPVASAMGALAAVALGTAAVLVTIFAMRAARASEASDRSLDRLVDLNLKFFVEFAGKVRALEGSTEARAQLMQQAVDELRELEPQIASSDPRRIEFAAILVDFARAISDDSGQSLGQTDAGAFAYEEAQRILDSSSASEFDYEFLVARARLLHGLTEQAMVRDELGEAEALELEAVAMLSTALESDAWSDDEYEELARLRQNFMSARMNRLMSAGELDEAIRLSEESLAFIQVRVDRDPTDTKAQLSLSYGYRNHGLAHHSNEQPDQAQAAFATSLEVLERVRDEIPPDEYSSSRLMLTMLRHKSLLMADDFSAALVLGETLSQELEAAMQADPGNALFRRQLASMSHDQGKALWRSARSAPDALPGLEPLAATERAVVHLRRSIELFGAMSADEAAYFYGGDPAEIDLELDAALAALEVLNGGS